MKTILFDMDGTLLNMGEHAFEKETLKRMNDFFEKKFPGKGKVIVTAVGCGIESMKKNDGKQSNELVYWQAFEQECGYKRADMESLFLEFYRTDYARIGDDYVPDENMKELVHLLEAKGYQLIVATNPLVPQIANQQRVLWSGTGDVNWLEITSFENYSSAKPNIRFYQEICKRFRLEPQECLMVGNSIRDDGAAQELGMEFYLILNEDSAEAVQDYRGRKGSRKDLLELVRGL